MTLTHTRHTPLSGPIATSVQRAGLQITSSTTNTQTPRFNIAPSQHHPVLALSSIHEPLCTLSSARWGTPSTRTKRPMINLRSETLTRRPSWLRRAHRVAVPIDGFYEWVGPRKNRTPLWIHANPSAPSSILWVAALLEPAAVPDEDDTFTLLTCPANTLIAPIHARMPVLLREEDLAFWLHPQTPLPLLKDLLQPAPPECLAVRAASSHANKATNDSQACLEEPKTLTLSPEDLLALLHSNAPRPRGRAAKATSRIPRETVPRRARPQQISLFDRA